MFIPNPRHSPASPQFPCLRPPVPLVLQLAHPRARLGRLRCARHVDPEYSTAKKTGAAGVPGTNTGANSEARGAQLNYQALWPKPVPDDQNFAATPPIKPGLRSHTVRTSTSVGRTTFRSPAGGSDATGAQSTNGNSWTLLPGKGPLPQSSPGKPAQSSPRRFCFQTNSIWSHAPRLPRASSKGLKTNEAVFAELRAASRRPFARYPFKYDTEFPRVHLVPNDLFAVCTRLELRPAPELAAGQSEKGP